MDRQTAAQIIEGYMKPVYGFACAAAPLRRTRRISRRKSA